MENNKKIKKKILVLGTDGMLGYMVYHFLIHNSSDKIYGTSRRESEMDKRIKYFEVYNFLKQPDIFRFLKQFDYIINCIGIIKPYTKNGNKGVQDAITINANFPYFLGSLLKNTKVKVIQIATDCVFSGREGNYNEDHIHDGFDIYDRTKSLGEINDQHFLHIRCSIIGPVTNVNLLEWFLSQKENSTVSGYINHKWNGVTTLQFAKLCFKIITTNVFYQLRDASHVHHFVPNEKVSKYYLLKQLNTIFDKNCIINKTKIGNLQDRTLDTKYTFLENLYGRMCLKDALEELKNYMVTYKLSCYA